jgi:hypothetical protein
MQNTLVPVDSPIGTNIKFLVSVQDINWYILTCRNIFIIGFLG